MNYFKSSEPFILESGEELPEITIAYTTYGSVNKDCDNVIWICHALTANSNAQEWWPGLIGHGLAFDTTKYYVVCANILGSCYGTTGPVSKQSESGNTLYRQFPSITIRDMVQAHQL